MKSDTKDMTLKIKKTVQQAEELNLSLDNEQDSAITHFFLWLCYFFIWLILML